MILLLLSLFSFSARADIVANVGVGRGVLYHDPFERSISVGFQRPLDGYSVRFELGAWGGGPGQPSVYGSFLVGMTVSPNEFGAESHVALGPTYISTPDSVLGGHFQINTEFGLGMKDKLFYQGVLYKHLSSAGIYQPNIGRDFLMLQLRSLKP